MDESEQYRRCEITFRSPGGEVLGAVEVEMTSRQLADAAFVHHVALDQLRRRGPSPLEGLIPTLQILRRFDEQAFDRLSVAHGGDVT
jgi:hypothetical protein